MTRMALPGTLYQLFGSIFLDKPSRYTAHMRHCIRKQINCFKVYQLSLQLIMFYISAALENWRLVWNIRL